MVDGELKNIIGETDLQKVHDLIETIRKGDCVAFVGSGVSQDAAYPSWGQLVKSLADHAGIGLDRDPSSFKADELIEKVQECKNGLAENYYDVIREIFNPLSKRPYSNMHVRILQLPFISYPTTNIDGCHIAARDGERVERIDGQYDVYPAMDVRRLGSKRIYYLHGKVVDGSGPFPIILSKDEYAEAYGDQEGPLPTFLKVLLQYDLCFIGFSMTDPFLNEWIRTARRIMQKHEQESAHHGVPYRLRPKYFALMPGQRMTLSHKVGTRPASVLKEEIVEAERLKKERDKLFKDQDIISIEYLVYDETHYSLTRLLDYMFRQLVANVSEAPPA